MCDSVGASPASPAFSRDPAEDDGGVALTREAGVDRARLAERQRALLDALVIGASAPEGFDREHLARSGEALIGKRARMIEKTWPGLAGALGESLRARFRSYALEHPLTTDDRVDDGRKFAEFLLRRRELPSAAAPMLLAVRLRTGWPFRALRIGGGVWAGVRLPLVGVRILRFKRPAAVE